MQIANVLIQLRGTSALQDLEVARALKLSDTQQLRIRDLHQRHRLSLRARVRQWLRGRDGERNVRESLERAAQESEQQVVSLLTAEQRQRFDRLRRRPV